MDRILSFFFSVLLRIFSKPSLSSSPSPCSPSSLPSLSKESDSEASEGSSAVLSGLSLQPGRSCVSEKRAQKHLGALSYGLRQFLQPEGEATTAAGVTLCLRLLRPWIPLAVLLEPRHHQYNSSCQMVQHLPLSPRLRSYVTCRTGLHLVTASLLFTAA